MFLALLNLPFTEPKLAKSMSSSQSQIIGSKFKLYCILEEGKKISFEWAKDGQTLTPFNDIRYRIENHSDESSLTIHKLTNSDSGNYKCLVRSSNGLSDQLSTVLIVKGLSRSVTLFSPQCVAQCGIYAI